MTVMTMGTTLRPPSRLPVTARLAPALAPHVGVPYDLELTEQLRREPAHFVDEQAAEALASRPGSSPSTWRSTTTPSSHGVYSTSDR